MSAHTPGPWTLQPLEEDFPGIGDSALGHQRIVGGNCLSPGIVFGGLRECESNARLIAAAPDLLAAAKLAVLNFARIQHADARDLFDDDHEAWTALEKAIAKAEGKGEA